MFSEASANLSVSTVFTLFLRELVVVCCADVTRRTLNIRDNIKVVLLAPKKKGGKARVSVSVSLTIFQCLHINEKSNLQGKIYCIYFSIILDILRRYEMDVSPLTRNISELG